METNKYTGTMFCHCDIALTDRMLAADTLVKKIEFLIEHLDADVLSPYFGMLTELDKKLVEKCVTPRFQLVHKTYGKAIDQFYSLLYHIKYVFREIYTNWVSGTTGYSPIFAESLSEIDNRLTKEETFRNILNGMNH